MIYATRKYLQSLPLDYDPNAVDRYGRQVWKSIPKHLEVRKVTFMQTRVFHEAQPDVLKDYWIEYEDGTADPISFADVQPLPRVGEFYERFTALFGGPYVVWNPSAVGASFQYGGVIREGKSKQVKPKTKYAARIPTPKEVVDFKVLLAAAQKANDKEGVAEVERAIRDFYEIRNRKANIRDRKGTTSPVHTLVF